MASGSMNSGSGTSKYTGGEGKSSLERLGIDARVANGTTGDRPDPSHAKYGGKGEKGMLFKGNSAAPSSKELNSGENERPSSAAGVLGAAAGTVGGSYGARQGTGNLPGKAGVKPALRGGAKGKPIDVNRLLKGGPVQDAKSFKDGTGRYDTMGRAMKGLRAKGGPKE